MRHKTLRSPRHFGVLSAHFGPRLAADETQLHRHMKPIPADLGGGDPVDGHGKLWIVQFMDGKMSTINGLLPLLTIEHGIN